MARDHENSDSSRASASPQSCPGFHQSPGSSPMQQVPELANVLSTLTCMDRQYTHSDFKKDKPCLVIKEQPNGYFRYRYPSEMAGTHGCITGNSGSKNKTHPSVELLNYPGEALILCRLAQCHTEDDHPHQLLHNDCHEDISVKVSPEKGYEARFPGLGIIHVGKKKIGEDIKKKLHAKGVTKILTEGELKSRTEEILKKIELDIVRLKFSAYNYNTMEEICDPVFSDPIRNLKSARTNDLKICRMSLCSGSPDGGDEVYLLVEKVGKKTIEVRFIELDNSGNVVWEANGSFSQNDVHHQYAIVFKTPQYKKTDITSDVRVFVELRRTNDGLTSNRLPFTYCAKPVYKLNKKRKAVSYSSIGSSDSSLKSISDIPATVVLANKTNEIAACTEYGINMNITIPKFNIQVPRATGDPLGDALMGIITSNSPHSVNDNSPLLGRGSAPTLPDVRFSSSEFNSIIFADDNMPSEEARRFLYETNIDEYLRFSDTSLGEIISDSAKIKREPSEVNEGQTENSLLRTDPIKIEVESNPEEYTASYTQEDGLEVKQIVKDLIEVIRSKAGKDKEYLRAQLEKLLSIRLCNGDTFLHMTLCTGVLSSMEYIVKVAHSVDAMHLLNSQNDKMQTVLHLAILHNMPYHVKFLISKGCDPMVTDIRGDTAVHYAVNNPSCLSPLLEAIKENNVTVDLNAHNKEMKTALHIAAYFNRAVSVKLLLSHSASYKARDFDGRIPLHLAVYGDSFDAAKVLLEFMPASDVDLWDAQGFSSLQVLCGSQLRPHTLAILELLLEKQADPMSHAENNKPAWVIARDKPELMELLKPHILKSGEVVDLDDFIKNESADEESDVDLWDAQGFSPLQVLCGSQLRPHTLGILELLLEKQADPMCHAENNKPAWVIARDKPEIMELLKPHILMSGEVVDLDDFIKNESADEESDVDLWDAQGFSPLQVLCGSQLRPHTLGILELLLEKQADPMCHAENNKPAWVIARDKPEIMELLKPHILMSGEVVDLDDFIKNESADEEEQNATVGSVPSSSVGESLS